MLYSSSLLVPQHSSYQSTLLFASFYPLFLPLTPTNQQSARYAENNIEYLTSCSCLNFLDQAPKSWSRSSSSFLSSFSRSSRPLSFSLRARARASQPALSIFCLFFSFNDSSS